MVDLAVRVRHPSGGALLNGSVKSQIHLRRCIFPRRILGGGNLFLWFGTQACGMVRDQHNFIASLYTDFF